LQAKWLRAARAPDGDHGCAGAPVQAGRPPWARPAWQHPPGRGALLRAARHTHEACPVQQRRRLAVPRPLDRARELRRAPP